MKNNFNARSSKVNEQFCDAILFNDVKKMKKIMSKKSFNINFRDINGNSPINMAVRSESADAVDLLITCGADLESKNCFGYTALYIASRRDNEKIVRMLVTAGADVNTQDKEGNTPLHVTSNMKVAGMLFKAGADITIENKDGMNPLTDAISSYIKMGGNAKKTNSKVNLTLKRK